MSILHTARTLLAAILEAEARAPEAESATSRYDAPGELARRHPAVRADIMARINTGDCGWVIPMHQDGEWAVLVYHPGSDARELGPDETTGWDVYVGEDIPLWIARQIPALGVGVLTSVEAAAALGLAASTTRNAAARGQVEGARPEPRPGTINAPWVASRAAWQSWFDSRRPMGRPPNRG